MVNSQTSASFIKSDYFSYWMPTETICIPEQEYLQLKKKAELADDMILQLESSLHDLEQGRIKRVR